MSAVIAEHDDHHDHKPRRTYRGKCAELCGKNHGFMPIVVDVKSDADYAAWVKEQKSAKAAAAASSNKTWSKTDLMAQGKKVYATKLGAFTTVGAGFRNFNPALIDITGNRIFLQTKRWHPPGMNNIIGGE